jgi:hypothetical protein
MADGPADSLMYEGFVRPIPARLFRMRLARVRMPERLRLANGRVLGGLVSRFHDDLGRLFLGMTYGLVLFRGRGLDGTDCAQAGAPWAGARRSRTARSSRARPGALPAGRWRAGVGRWIKARKVRNVMVDQGQRYGCLSLEAVGHVAIARGGATLGMPDTVIGILKLPVNAARPAGDVKTVVWGAAVLVSGVKLLPLVPASLRVPSNGEAL